jgi:hypothetical protein
MVAYTFDEKQISITESENQEDVSFLIEVKTEEMRNRVKQVRAYFDENKDYTDVLFYSHQDGHFEIIVRKDMVLPFLLQAFRFRCIESLRWK